MKNFEKILKNTLGLTDAQAKVYLATLEIGEGNLQEIARKSGVKRTSIYNFIDELKAKGLLIETKKKKRKIFSAINPEQLIEVEKTRLAELERTLPELRAIYNKTRSKPKVSFYEGIEGIKEVYADMLADKHQIVAFEDLEHMKIALPKAFYEYFPPERARRGILFRSILRDTPIARDFVEHNRQLLRQSKLLDSGDWKTELNIYGKKVAMMSFRAKTPFCVLIEDEAIAETLRSVWENLWESIPGSAFN